ncbi:MAG: HupC [Paucimonas sp.]|nr:HupC [Paucimonas sp.]
MPDQAGVAAPTAGKTQQRTWYYRHRLPVRIMHWVNALCLVVLFMSGMGIFNAHPALYWGQSSYSSQPALLEIGVLDGRGVLRVGDWRLDTTGVLGLSTGKNGQPQSFAFPHWITIPGSYSLASSRQWHFFFAWLFVINGIAYLLYALFSGHFKRDLVPGPRELRGIPASVKEHLLLRHPQGEQAKRYNVLQKLAYLAVILLMLPLVALMGMAMSPMLDSVIPGWVAWFGGRQAVRTIHFILAWLLLAFVMVHIFEVIISGVWNHLRSMITGWFAVDGNGGHHEINR